MSPGDHGEADAVEIRTAHGPARVHLRPVAEPRGLVMLGHGAGGGGAAPDLRTATEVFQEEGWSVALVEQAHRGAVRRARAPARPLGGARTGVQARLPAAPAL